VCATRAICGKLKSTVGPHGLYPVMNLRGGLGFEEEGGGGSSPRSGARGAATCGRVSVSPTSNSVPGPTARLRNVHEEGC